MAGDGTTSAAATGPIEDRSWPERLQARVTEPGSAPRLHGYDVQGDLARHYRFGEVLLLALTGEAPDEETGRAFEIALTFAAPAPVNEAPAHAAMLARVCGSRTAGIVAVGAITLAEQARTTLDEHGELLATLASGEIDRVPASLEALSSEDREAVARLRAALGPFCSRVPAIACDLRLETAILAVLLACGLRRREELETALCVGGLGVVCAEALARDGGGLRGYAIDLPHFTYTGQQHD